MKDTRKKPLAAAIGMAMVASVSATVVNAGVNPFSTTELPAGYNMNQPAEGKCGGNSPEGKCGEGKCGEGKCGGQKCQDGSHEKGQCDGKTPEGKCGEGMCGHSAPPPADDGSKQDDAGKMPEGKCGEGKCGAAPAK